MKILKILWKVWDFVSRFAYVVTKFDEWIEQCQMFWKWLTGDDEDEPDLKGN